MLDWKRRSKDAYLDRIDPSSVHSAAPAGAWRNPVAQHTDREKAREDKSLLSLGSACMSETVRRPFSCSVIFPVTTLCLLSPPYLLSKQQVALWFWRPTCRLRHIQADVSRPCALLRPVRLLLLLFVGEAVARPLGAGTLRPSVSRGCCPTHAPDDDRGRAVSQEDVRVVLRLLRVA